MAQVFLEWLTFLSQTGALCDMGLVHFGIWATGLFILGNIKIHLHFLPFLNIGMAESVNKKWQNTIYIYIYICMYVCMYVCLCVFMYIYIYIYIYESACCCGQCVTMWSSSSDPASDRLGCRREFHTDLFSSFIFFRQIDIITIYIYIYQIK